MINVIAFRFQIFYSEKNGSDWVKTIHKLILLTEIESQTNIYFNLKGIF